LKDLDVKIGTTVLAGIKSKFKNSDVAFYNAVGEMIFVETVHGPVPPTLWEFSRKEETVCVDIAKSIDTTSRIYPKTMKMLKDRGGNESDLPASTQSNSNGKRRFEQRSASEQRPTSEHRSVTLGENGNRVPCSVCGGKMCAKGDCFLWNHPHANKNRKIPWSESKWGDIYLNMVPKKTSYLPNMA